MTEFKDAPVTDVDLADFDDVFQSSEADERDYQPVPDGKYQVRVETVELARTPKGDPILKWMLRILGPTCEGRVLFRNNVISTDENVGWLKKDLYTCGLRLTRLSELPANLERLLDIRLEVLKKTKGDYESVYFNKRIKTADEAAPAGTAGQAKPAPTKATSKARSELSKF